MKEWFKEELLFDVDSLPPKEALNAPSSKKDSILTDMVTGKL